MDSFVESLQGKCLNLEDCEKLVDFSRGGVLRSYSNFRRICSWFHEAKGSVQDRKLSTVIANVLLRAVDVRERAVVDLEICLIADVQNRLYESPKDQAKWRILFLLVYSRPSEEPDFSLCKEMFDRFLAPTLFRRMVHDFSADDLCNVSVFNELGKFWYALCYNYEYSLDKAQLYWEAFEELNVKVSGTLEEFEDCLIQLGSIYILLHSEHMSVGAPMVCNILQIFERKVVKWSEQAALELYCPLEEHRLPQVLNIMELLILHSSTDIRNHIRNCFMNVKDNSKFPHVGSAFIKLIESPINNASNTTSSILKLLHLRHDKESHVLMEQFNSSEHIPLSINISSDFPTPLSSTTSNNDDSTNFDHDDEHWSEEDQLQDANKVFEAIERLNDLGILKISSS